MTDKVPSSNAGVRAAQLNRWAAMHAGAKDPIFRRAFAAAIGIAAAIPLAMVLASLVIFPLLFFLESLLIGAYPFLATVRPASSTSTYVLIFPFNWLLTVLQWCAIAAVFALIAKAKSIVDVGDHVILAVGVWIATNIVVRLLLLVFSITVVTTPVRM